MFIKVTASGYRGTEQFSSGRFLLAFSNATDTYISNEGKTLERIYCCVRRVSLRQCGCWMMGRAKVWKHSFTVSGEFGNDGLPLGFRAMKGREHYDLSTYDIDVLKRRFLVPVPEALSTLYWSGSGHNEVGPTKSQFREFACTKGLV